MISLLPSWLQFGYMPPIGDAKSQVVPAWVVIICALTMVAGTAAGGSKIIKTMGHKMVKLQPVHGFAAEQPRPPSLPSPDPRHAVSTTHAITSAILGVGAAKRLNSIKFGVIEKILWAWVFTIPAAAGVAFALVWWAKKPPSSNSQPARPSPAVQLTEREPISRSFCFPGAVYSPADRPGAFPGVVDRRFPAGTKFDNLVTTV